MANDKLDIAMRASLDGDQIWFSIYGELCREKGVYTALCAMTDDQKHALDDRVEVYLQEKLTEFAEKIRAIICPSGLTW